VASQPPEFWNQYQTELPPGAHVRIHPLLDWTELNVWEYIEREGIPVIPLYFDQGSGTRYRSIGCGPCTFPVASRSRNVAEIIAELRDGALARVAERAGRAQDADGGGTLEALRRDGYM
jgi:sulfate adenylyltransferase subunit 2